MGGCRDVSNLDELINNLDPFLVLVHVRSRLKLFNISKVINYVLCK